MAPKDEDRAAILARRQRFVTAALAGITTSTLATACPCLDVDVPPDETDSDTDDATDDATTAATENDGTAGSGGSESSGNATGSSSEGDASGSSSATGVETGGGG